MYRQLRTRNFKLPKFLIEHAHDHMCRAIHSEKVTILLLFDIVGYMLFQCKNHRLTYSKRASGSEINLLSDKLLQKTLFAYAVASSKPRKTS